MTQGARSLVQDRLYPATGMLDVPAQRGKPIRLMIEIAWGSPSQTFWLRTKLSPFSS